MMVGDGIFEIRRSGGREEGCPLRRDKHPPPHPIRQSGFAFDVFLEKKVIME